MAHSHEKTYSGYRGAGIRLSEPLLPSIQAHSSEVEAPLLYAYHRFDKAHLVMLAERAIVPRADAAAMLKALLEMEAEGVEAVRLKTGGGMHSGEQYLIQRLGEEVGGRIHLGRSSGDLGTTGRYIRVRDQLIELQSAINDFRGAVLDVADRHWETVMPGYSHSQHAQPVTLGHQLLAWASVLQRDFERASVACQRVDRSPAGAGIMTGTDQPIDRMRVAELLGFEEVIPNTFDAVLSQDVVLDAFFALASLSLNLARWAMDLNFWYTSEAGYIDLPDRFCGTSSIMMQKKNPYVLEFIRGAGAEAAGGLTTALSVLKTSSGDPMQDRQYLYDALFRSFAYALRDLRWFQELLPALTANRERLRTMAGSYWAQATDVAGALVREKGMPWRTAHQIVGILVRMSYERGVRPVEVTPALLDEAAVAYSGEPVSLDEKILAEALDPSAFVRRRTLYGGPAPEECRRRWVEFQARLVADRLLVEQRQGKLSAAQDGLERAIDAIIGSAAKK